LPCREEKKEIGSTKKEKGSLIEIQQKTTRRRRQEVQGEKNAQKKVGEKEG